MMYEIYWVDDRRKQLAIKDETDQLMYLVDPVKRNLLGGYTVYDPKTKEECMHVKYKQWMIIPGFRVTGVNDFKIDARNSFLNRYKLSKTLYGVDIGEEHYMDLFYSDQKVGFMDYHPDWEHSRLLFEMNLANSQHLTAAIGICLGHYICERQQRLASR